ncbi:MAG TPA: DUF4340 domain-containing protein [Opitutaceae bacterium]|jgi:hypothetical protein
MKLKTLVAVVIVLAVLSGAAYWLNRPPAQPAPDPRVGKLLVDSATITGSTTIKLTDQGKTVQLSRQANGTWLDDSYFGLPADFSKLSSFTNDLSSAKIDRLVTQNPERIARLEFGSTSLALLDAKGVTLWSLNLGKSADQGGRFVRFGDESKAYLASLNAWIDNDAKSWADAQLLNLKSDDIAKIEIPLEDHSAVTVTRKTKDEAWKCADAPAGKQLNSDKLATILSSLTSVRFTDSSSPADPQAKSALAHERVFKLTTFAGKTYTVALGRKPEEKVLKTLAGNSKVDLTFKPGEGKDAAKTPTPEYETIPAGPVYVWVTPMPSDAYDKRTFQIDEYTFTSLPQKADDLFQAAVKK